MKKLSVFVIGLMLILGTSLVGAQTSNDLPGGSFAADTQVQNVGSGPADILYTAYGTDGTSYDCGSKSAVAVGASVTYLASACNALPAGFQGSAVVSSNENMAAIVNVNNRSGGGTAAGQYQGSGQSDINEKIVFPLVKSDFASRTTTFYIQNAGAQANISVSFSTSTDGNAPFATNTKTYTNVPANAMVVVNPSDAGVPAKHLGSLTATSTSKLAGTSLEHETTAAQATNLQASKAFNPNNADSTYVCPLYRREHTGNMFSTGLQAQNVHTTAQDITMTFTYGEESKSFTKTAVPAGASATFFAPQLDGIPAGAVGSAKVVGSAGNIVAVVNDRGFAASPSPLTTYACFAESSATTKVVIPLYKENFAKNTTGLAIQNVSSSPAEVTVTYTTSAGKVISLKKSGVAAGASAIFYNVSSAQSGINLSSGSLSDLAKSVGGVTITSDQAIVAIANESQNVGDGSAKSGQDNKNYEGTNQ